MTEAWLRPKNFKLRYKILVSQQDLIEMCRDKEILCHDIVGQTRKNFVFV